jgi:hypothetical protein
MLSSEAAPAAIIHCPLAAGVSGNNCHFFPLSSGRSNNVKGSSMKKIAMSALMVGALGLGSVATTAPAEAHWRGGWGPGIAGGVVAGAVIGGLASSAYGWGPGYGYYGGPSYYSAGYYGGPYAYDYDEPYRWGGGYTTTYYTTPVSYGYRYRRVVRPAYAYYRGSYPIVRHHWHRHYRHW